MSITGQKELDIEILLNLSDYELIKVCEVNKYVNSICNSDAFWYKRVIKRIENVRNDNFKKEKTLVFAEITADRIRELMSFYGFNNLKEFNKYLNTLPEKSLYLFYFDSITWLSGIFDESYRIEKEKLPKYINYDELIYEIRRQYIRNYFTPDRDIISSPIINLVNIPGYNRNDTFAQKIYDDVYNIYKRLGIIK